MYRPRPWWQENIAQIVASTQNSPFLILIAASCCIGEREIILVFISVWVSYGILSELNSEFLHFL